MPGHVLSAKCTCGFEREVAPGATVNQLRVIAYTADGCDLVTVESEKAKAANLTVIEDPWLKAQEAAPYVSFDSSWGPPYQCPRCTQDSLQLRPTGLWD
jgi:hypothetical protein